MTQTVASLKEQIAQETLTLQKTAEKLEKQKQRLCENVAEQAEALQGLNSRIAALQSLKDELLNGHAGDVSPVLSPKSSFHGVHPAAAASSSSPPSHSAEPTRIDNIFAAIEQTFAAEAQQLQHLLKKLESVMLPEVKTEHHQRSLSGSSSGMSSSSSNLRASVGLQPGTVGQGIDFNDTKLASFASKLRRTAIVVLSRGDVVGAKVHFDKHRKGCDACTARYKRFKAEYGRDKKLLGKDCAIPMKKVVDGVEKRLVAADLFLSSEPCIAERREYEVNPLIDFFRVSADVVCSKKNGLTWTRADAQRLAQAMQTKLEDALGHVDVATFQKAQQVASGSSQAAPAAARSEGGEATASSPEKKEERAAEVLTAVERVIHVLKHSINVTADREVPGSSQFIFKVRISVGVPASASALDPLRELLRDPHRSKDHFKAIVSPLLRTFSSVIPQSAGATIGDNSTLDFLARISRAALMNGSSPTSRLSELLEVLACCQVSVRINARVPRPTHGGPSAAVDVAESLLKHFTSPDQWEPMPRMNAPELCDFTLVLDSCPTVLIEAVNKIFNSHHKLPDTARQSKLDGLMSPAAKVSLGLKMFSELVVEIYRPYSPILDASALSPRSKCGPKVNLPPDIIHSCVEVDKGFRHLIREVEQQREELQHKTLPTEAIQVDKDVDAAAQDVAHVAQTEVHSLEAVLNEFQTTIDSATSCCIQALLPVALDMSPTSEDIRRKLVYLHIQGHI